MLKLVKEALTNNGLIIQKYFKEKISKIGFEEICYSENEYLAYSTNKDELRPTVVAHFDTINGNEAVLAGDLEFSSNNNKISLKSSSKSKCLGGDDRNGIAIIAHLMMKRKDDYHFILCGQEETGGIGSKALVMNPNFEKINSSIFIGLDREGVFNFVTYNKGNNTIIEELEDRGFEKEHGSYSDVATLAEDTKISCINIAVGYSGQHTKREVIHLNHLEQTLNLLKDDTFIAFLKEKAYEVEEKSIYGGYGIYGYGNGYYDQFDYDDNYDETDYFARKTAKVTTPKQITPRITVPSKTNRRDLNGVRARRKEIFSLKPAVVKMLKEFVENNGICTKRNCGICKVKDIITACDIRSTIGRGLDAKDILAIRTFRREKAIRKEIIRQKGKCIFGYKCNYCLLSVNMSGCKYLEDEKRKEILVKNNSK